MNKIYEAQEVLKALGLPKQQQNEISALTLLALCQIKEIDLWRNASKASMRITKDIMEFVNSNYKQDAPYAPNSRESFRRQVLHQFVQGGIATYNPDNPNLPVNSPSAHYALTDEALNVIKSFGSEDWDEKIKVFCNIQEILNEKYSRARRIKRIPIIINGVNYTLSPGKHNEVQLAVVYEFAPRFAPGSQLLYIGDTENKDLYINHEKFDAIKIVITEHSKLPDIVLFDEHKGWLFFIEVVTSHGPISPKRMMEIEEMTEKCNFGKVYVTAFPTIKEFKKYTSEIAWETEIWIADTPDHMIHFNGDRFIGPR
jgi:hypothetical protein